MRTFLPEIRGSQQAPPEDLSSRAGTGDSRNQINSCQEVLMMVIMKDSTFLGDLMMERTN